MSDLKVRPRTLVPSRKPKTGPPPRHGRGRQKAGPTRVAAPGFEFAYRFESLLPCYNEILTTQGL